MKPVDGFLNMKAEVLSKEKKNISYSECYCYKIQIRHQEKNKTLHSKRVFQ